MLSGAKLERMLAEPSFADACRIAVEGGYEDMSQMDVAGINASLAAFRARERAEIGDLAPDVAVLDLFRMKYGYHNAKVLVKSQGDAQADADLLSDAARFTPERSAIFPTRAQSILRERKQSRLANARPTCPAGTASSGNTSMNTPCS